MNVAGEILQHKNKKAPFIALFLTIYYVFVCIVTPKGIGKPYNSID